MSSSPATEAEKESPELTGSSPEEAVVTRDGEDEYITGVKLWLVLGSITLTCFLALLDTTIVATAIPRITNHFHSLDDVGWYGSAYLLCNTEVLQQQGPYLLNHSCSLQPLSGKLYTYFSSKYTFLTFVFLFELGSLLCGVAVSSNMLIVGRAVAGMGSSGLMNGAMTILTNSLPIEKRPKLGAQVAIAIGPVIGGALTQYANWRWCFYINLPCGLCIAAFMFFIEIPQRLHSSTAMLKPLQRIQHLDLLGFGLFAPAIVQFLLALEWGGITYPWSSSHVIGLFVGSFFTLLLFLYREYRVGDEAMIPFSMVKILPVWTSCLVYMLSMGVVVSVSYYLPIYFQAVRDVSPTLSGVYTLPMILSSMLAAVFSGWGVQKIQYYIPFVIVASVLTTISYGLLSTLTPFSSAGKWAGYQIIGGIGRGLSIQMPLIAIQNNLTPDLIPIGTTLLMFCQYFGGTLSLSFSQTAFTTSLRNNKKVDAAQENGAPEVKEAGVV
ncbi:MFS multidrug transporter protein [Rutstroemia sp. NJR-2017a WRK4]|nr:MFS multidrug transporter protein [Rutstroemia sp. NJR-2017a WRK4]